MLKWTFKWMTNRWRKLLLYYFNHMNEFSNSNEFSFGTYSNPQTVLPLTYIISVPIQYLIKNGFTDPNNNNFRSILIEDFTISDGIFKGLKFYDLIKTSNQIVSIRLNRLTNSVVSQFGTYSFGWTSTGKVFFYSTKDFQGFPWNDTTSATVYFVPLTNISR